MSDRRIKASELRVGDELHLRFMGGDDYVTVESVVNSDGLICWKGSAFHLPPLGDCVPSGTMLDVLAADSPNSEVGD